MIISALLTLSCLPSAAQLNGTGFYRFRNAQNTSNYISMTNDMFNFTTAISTACGGLSSASSEAGQSRALACVGKFLQTDIHMVEDTNIISPSSIIFASAKGGSSSDFNLIGQGTSLLTLTTGTYPGTVKLKFQNRYITITKVSGSGANSLYTAKIELKSDTYVIFVGYPNLGTRYLIDDGGVFSISESYSANNAKWFIEPVSHFNVLPEIGYNGKFNIYKDKYYTTLYVPYAFQLSSVGSVEKAYVVKAIGTDGVLDLETIATKGNGTVPAGTPVILECSSNVAAECQLIPTGTPLFTAPDVSITADAPRATTATNYTGTNLLKGNYYCNQDGSLSFPTPSGTSSFNANHYTARTNSMYVIGVTSSGKLGMVKATGTAMPANKAWIEYTGTAELVFPNQNSIPGDVNKDGGVDVGDVVATVNIIQGRDSGFDYDYNAADIDGNGTYDVTDVTGIVNIIQGRQ